MSEDSLHPITAVVKNQSGVLSRIAGLFARRGFNIDSLAVGETPDPSYSRISIVVKGDEENLNQVIKQLDKLIEVIEVKDLSKHSHLETELVLMEVQADEGKRSSIIELAQVFDCRIPDVGADSLTLEITGSPEKVSSFQTLMEDYGVTKMARTGKVVLERPSAGEKQKELKND